MLDASLFALPGDAPKPPAPAPACKTAVFAGRSNPLRISALTGLKQCEARALLAWWEEAMGAISEGGAAADTGTAVGMAVELWHRDRDASTDDILARVEAASRGVTPRPQFPAADLGAARRTLDRYRADPRNQEAVVPSYSLELRVTLELPPHATDPTQRPIALVGHLDQLRELPGGMLEVWDLKHSRFAGHELVASYAWQQALYALAAEETLRRPVRWGGIIRTSGYLVRGAQSKAPDEFNVFFPSYYGPEHCRAVADSVRLAVANIRAGHIALRPGDHCFYCPAGDLLRCSQDVRSLTV